MSDIALGLGMPTGLDHEEAIDRAGDLDFDFVELIMHGELDHEGMARQADRLSTLLSKHDLGLVVHLPMPIDLGSPFEPIRAGNVAALEECIEAATTAGARKGVLHPVSKASGSWPDERVRDAIVRSVRELDEFGRDREFEVCAENIFGRQFTVETIGELLAATDVSMTLDTGHGRLTGVDEAGMAAFADEHRDRISHLHLNDNRVGAGRDGDEHIPFGAGTTDFETLLEPFLETDWTGTMSFELLTFNYEYYRSSKEQFEALR